MNKRQQRLKIIKIDCKKRTGIKGMEYRFIEINSGEYERRLLYRKGFLYSEYSRHGGVAQGVAYLKCYEKDCPLRANLKHGIFTKSNRHPRHNHHNRHVHIAQATN